MPFRCDRCSRCFDDDVALAIGHRCLSCGGRLLSLSESSVVSGGVSLPGLDRLPSLLAIPLHELAVEPHPVLQLHRLCDAVEILTRFCTVVALGEWRVRLGTQAW